jgi:hypothetical protein
LPRCLIGMEACATAHYWARELTKLGHEVRLMPAKDVKDMTAPERFADSQIPLAPRAPSIHDPRRTFSVKQKP